MSRPSKQRWTIAPRLVLAILWALIAQSVAQASNPLRNLPAGTDLSGRFLETNGALAPQLPNAVQKSLAPAGNPPKSKIESPSGNPLTDRLTFSQTERLLFDDVADGRFRKLSLIDAGLIASGVDDPSVDSRAERQFAEAVNEIKRAYDGELRIDGNDVRPSQTLARVERVHHVLHQRLLRGGYNADASSLATTLETGVYNCASATLLFVALAQEMNLDAQAVEMPGHVRAIVNCDGQQYAVEVTCPVWADAIRPKNDLENSLGVDQTWRSVRGSQERDVSSAGLVAMIYYNRGIDAFNTGRYSDAIIANRKALLLDAESRNARGNLLAAVNNWALALGDEGDFAAAESLLDFGQQFDPQHLPFSQNRAHIEQLWSGLQATVVGKQ
jgi:hypothetical protein